MATQRLIRARIACSALVIAVLLVPLAPATLLVRSVLRPLSERRSLSCLLGEAVDDGDLATVSRLQAQGASPNARWEEGCTERTILNVHPPRTPEPAEAWATMTCPERAVLDQAVGRWSLAIVKE
jgi:hypothetical protein